VRRLDPLVEIGRAPWRHDFFQALRWIEATHPDRPRLGTARRPVDEPLRLGQLADLSFAPSALHGVVPATATRKARLEVRFFGLFGPNGPLPYHLTEYARARSLHQGDDSFARFADLFHHRLLLLFYRAWAQAQPAVGLDRPGDDHFSTYVGSLIGMGTASQQQRSAVHDHAKLHFAGLFSRQVRNAAGLEAMLSAYLRRTVRVEQFVGRWLGLEAAEQSRIGRTGLRRKNPSSMLGAGAVLGRTVWDRQHNFRIHIEALDAAAFESLLPGGKSLAALAALVEHYLGLEFGWDLQLWLQPEQVKPCRLGRFGQLGWTSWLGSRTRKGAAALTLVPRGP
jgi:type VI secretion system protein ImpH